MLRLVGGSPECARYGPQPLDPKLTLQEPKQETPTDNVNPMQER